MQVHAMATQASTAPQSPTALGQPRWFFGALTEVKASAADTAGQYTLLEVTLPPHLQSPLHVHYTEDEGFYVLDGTVSIIVGERTVAARARPARLRAARCPAPVHGRPRRRPHDLDSHPRRFRELRRRGERARANAHRPPASVVPPENIVEIVRRHGKELLTGVKPGGRGGPWRTPRAGVPIRRRRLGVARECLGTVRVCALLALSQGLLSQAPREAHAFA
jgi:hypothetical protein